MVPPEKHPRQNPSKIGLRVTLSLERDLSVDRRILDLPNAMPAAVGFGSNT